jgi:peptidoglycan/LPS O-acetylase OafA/YrhL
MSFAMPEDHVEPAVGASDTAVRDGGGRLAPLGISGGYQPALDGIRAIAVGLVIMFHLGQQWRGTPLGGGWIGVDVFFVLSGYLITALLLAERRKTGRTNLRNFYARRLLRLAPLSILLVAVCWGGERIGLRSSLGLYLPTKGAVAILLYFANWMHLWHPGSPGSLMHTWSLSIEEQFYLVWPTVVVAGFALAKRNARWLLAAMAAGAAVACALYRRHLWYQATASWSGLGQAWKHFYYSSFQRPDGLVIGCLVALCLHGLRPTRLRRIVADVFGVVASVVAAAIIVRARFTTGLTNVRFIPVWGLSAMNVSVAVVLVSLVLHPTSLGARALSLRPLRWVGRRAYGIYLIHPLIVAIVKRYSPWAGFVSAVLVVGVTLALAAASFRWIERPFLRRKDRFSSHVAPEPPT